eukprot:CAMPEP_0196596390 /NCGR_PEP_ID=MMETSP1081-20130531/85825_1 /TAXON_ID=36882 /ORGANISM="Pyramimonas amylifera, Strain CCMP720" /LENGTH=94 /DNA_ID=CAMNT_0041921367 /DNA_START=1 /DNA_END=281 /DNA_ORIENTATION=-
MYEDDDALVERVDPLASLLEAAPMRGSFQPALRMEEDDNYEYDDEEDSPDSPNEIEPEPAEYSLAAFRGKRQKRSRVVMVDGIPVLRSNMYDLA